MPSGINLRDKIVIGLTGMPGSGKSVVTRIARESGYGLVVMGDVIREEVKRQGLQPTSKNLGEIMLELRKREGPAVISKKCIPKIKHLPFDKVVIDGIRSLHEVKEFTKAFTKFTLIAIHSSPETRFKRINRRLRSDAPKNWEIFCNRDERELKVGLGSAIAMARYMIVNEDRLESVKKKIRETLERIGARWMR